MASPFVPKEKHGILLRSPLSHGFAPASYASSTHLTFRGQSMAVKTRGSENAKRFYARNNPHPVRVRHLKGYLNVPVCSVEDRSAERRPVSEPSGRTFGPPYYPPGSTRYGANITKGIPAVGVVPVTFAWRDELEKRTHDAISHALGQFPSRAGLVSQASSRAGRTGPDYFGSLDDTKLLDWLCKILQTDSIPACQAWLASCTESEKMIVLNMIKMAADGEFERSLARSRPKTHESQYRYVWTPQLSLTSRYRSKSDSAVRLGTGRDYRTSGSVSGPLHQIDTRSTFPKHDIIKTTQQLSNAASRQSNTHRRSSSLTSARPKLNEVTSSRMPLTKQVRSKSATPLNNDSRFPVKATVTQERIQSGTQSKMAKLRYTSHWGEQ